MGPFCTEDTEGFAENPVICKYNCIWMLSCAPAYHHHTNIVSASHKLSNNSETNVGFPPKLPILSTLTQYFDTDPHLCPYYLRVQLLVHLEFFYSKKSSLKLNNSSSNSNPPHPHISPPPTTQDEVCRPLVSYIPSLGCSRLCPVGKPSDCHHQARQRPHRCLGQRGHPC